MIVYEEEFKPEAATNLDVTIQEKNGMRNIKILNSEPFTFLRSMSLFLYDYAS